MASTPPYTRQPAPPSIRTFSSGSTTLQSSLSPTSTLASPTSRPTGLGIFSSSDSTASSPTSPAAGPAERNFFGALVQKARSRSRSRSRNRVHRSRSRSPLPAPQSTHSHPYRYQQPMATATRPSIRPLSGMMSPPSHNEPRRLESRSSTSSSEDFYYGRHSNQWLFGNFSIRDTVRDVVCRSSSEKSRK